MNHESQNHDKHQGHSPEMFKRKFWLTLVLAIPVLLYSGTIQDLLHFSMPTFAGSQWLPAALGTIIFFYGGLVFLKGAKAEISNKQPGMMTLISLAISVAFSYSLAVSFKLVTGMDFWWELATLIVIMLLGHWMEMVSVMNAQGALKELAKLLPDEAELVTAAGDGIKKIPVSELKAGDMVLVRPGAQIPADGEVAKGHSEVNESMLTGESKPVKKTVKAQVIAGTINGSGSLTIKVIKVGGNTALAGIMRLVAEAQSSKSKTQIVADKAASYLTFAALAAALVTWTAWAIAGESAGFILERVVTVLVIACPHALGLAVPLVTAISVTLAAKNGLLVRQRIALEAARNVDVILFDKTGTLTEGRQGIVGIVAVGDEHALLALAAAVEFESEHAIARAIVASAKDQKLDIPRATNFKALPGRGAAATVAGKTVQVGGPNMIKELQAQMPDVITQAVAEASKDGKTVVYVIENKLVRGAIMLADVIRQESKEAVATLQGMGKRVAMLTGDSQSVASWVAKELGIKEYFYEVLPANKAQTVKQLQADGSKVAMVGDGVNDAPALAQSDIGIAIGAGTDVAIESAGIVLAGDDPRGVAKVITLSKATYRKMVQNLAWAVGYNVIAIPLAAGAMAAFGFVLSPAVGAVLMSLSTIIVALNAQLLRRTKLSNHYLSRS
ncbi:MAG TPA: heavy metal translocating P-type ATPase [Patescibacteria group bacterium]|nr:heavy metal translocating P-type ATPase [Patescibacteria group bacterium]